VGGFTRRQVPQQTIWSGGKGAIAGSDCSSVVQVESGTVSLSLGNNSSSILDYTMAQTFYRTISLSHMPTMIARLKTIIVAIVACAALSGCAVMQPPNAAGPTGGGPLYPILMIEDSERQEATAVALMRLASENAGVSSARLQPVTGTVSSLPQRPTTPLYLTKLGAGAVMTEEETRESLRRFIVQWQELIGSDPTKLSLVERTDQPDGSKVALYEQRPFRYPLRGGYGKLQIKFGPDRRIIDVNSSCIPDAERIQTALSALTIRFKAEDAVARLRTQPLSYTDANGNKQNLTLPAAGDIVAKGLTTYVMPARDRADTLEFHLAWEIEITNAPVRMVYLDAITGEIVSVQ
jgi:uncharacterized protein YceK